MSKQIIHRLRSILIALTLISINVTMLPSQPTAAAPNLAGDHKVAADFQAYWNAHGGLRLNGLPITDEAQQVSLTDGKSYATQWFERARYERHPENPAASQVLLGLLGQNQVEGRTFDVASKQQSDATQIYFAETKHSLSNSPAPFRSYWEQNGGLAQFGYPLSEQIQEVSTDGKTYTTQYFQRQRFEYHPGEANPDYKVQLGLLGVQQYKQQFVAQPDNTANLAHNVDQLTIGTSQEPDSLFSPNTSAQVSSNILTTIENGLVGIDDKNQFYPDLAAFVPSLENGAAQFIGPDGPDQYLQVKWKLRRGIKWADGVEFTAKDVIYGWQGIFENSNVQVVDRSSADQIFSFVAVDDYTVVANYLSENQAQALVAKDKDRYIQYAGQKGPVVNPLFATNAFVFPEHAYGKLDAAKLQDSDYSRNPLGTGPYKVRQWVPGQAIVLEPNPYYSLSPNKPAFKTVTFKIVEDTNQLLAQLQIGQIDMATPEALSLDQIPTLDKIADAGKTKPYYTPSSSWELIDFNLDRPIFQDKRVRQAFAYAINRQQIVNKILYGKTVVAHTWITPNITQFFATDVKKYGYDLDKARQMLKDAGYTAGSDGILSGPGGKLSFKYQVVAGNALRASIVQLVSADLKAVGIDAQLEFIPTKQIYAPDGPYYRRRFDFLEHGWISSADPGGALYNSAGIPSEANGWTGQNASGWSNAENDRLLNLAVTDKNVALNPTKRAEVYKAEQKIFAEELPVIPLFVRLEVTAAPAALKNYRPTGSTVPLTWNIQEWRLSK